MCVARLFSLLVFGKKKPFILDGPGMERSLWSAFTIGRCNEGFEAIYSYTVKYDKTSGSAALFEGQEKENSIQFRRETVTALLNLNLLQLPDAQSLDGNFRGLSVLDSNGRVYPKRLSVAMEDEILALLTPYLDELKKAREEEPTMLDGPEMYKSPWTAFVLSRTSSNTQYSFWFKVKETDDGASVSGSCQDKDGRYYETETDIPISGEDLWKFRWMALDQLPDEEPRPEHLEQPLDMDSEKLQIFLSDGTVAQKSIGSNAFMEIYQLLFPYITNNQS